MHEINSLTIQIPIKHSLTLRQKNDAIKHGQNIRSWLMNRENNGFLKSFCEVRTPFNNGLRSKGI